MATDAARLPEQLTLRDIFAMVALMGENWAGRLTDSGSYIPGTWDGMFPDGMAEHCYLIADAMLKAREGSDDLDDDA